MGFDFKGRTVGIVETGRIGMAVAGLMRGFDCHVLAHDPVPNAEFEAAGGRDVDLERLLSVLDIITLQCPLTPVSRHLIDAAAIARVKPGVMLINTSRGAVVDTRAVIGGLKSGAIGFLGLDAYEEEADFFRESFGPDDTR